MTDTQHSAAVSLDQLAAAISAARPTFNQAQERVALALYRLLAQGQPVSVASLADHLGRPSEAVGRTLAGWRELFRDEQQRIVGFHGLSLVETAHRLRVNGRELYAWCA